MKKDIVYSIRMSILVRESLKRAAHKERRTVASLLDKIILDYLEDERYLKLSETETDRREFQDRRAFLRKKITLPATMTIKIEGKPETLVCVILDIAMGGILVSFPRNPRINLSTTGELQHFKLSFHLPQIEDKLHFQCDTRRIIEKDREIHVSAVIREADDETLKRLKFYLI
jgi:predicted DNA-binding protein